MLCSFLSKAQEKVVVDEGVIWTSLSEKVKVNDNWGLSGAFQYRNFVDREDVFHLFFTVGATRKLSNGFSIGGGFTSLNIHRDVDGTSLLVPEIRPYQSLQFTYPMDKSKFNWKAMVEERFFRRTGNGELQSGYDGNWRFRNKFQFTFPLAASLNLELSSEVMFNTGERININVFDQHRGIVQFHYALGAFKVSTGYQNWFFQTGAGVHENRHTWLIGLTHSLDLSK